ncbi:hypothetical protein OS493_035589 [Desmophyllum pertusum]|uniref:Uncharacterized protein n=1 Tax=Desmophyllum pertusum TaxID=174260 RepID=A0A9W9ZWI6_9CNID|nr:hypothetical protein OS493_035589 [Desmophyllum pertusum]
MEQQYNQLLATSKTVGDFYQNVYAPVLQTLPWIDNGDGLKTASEQVLGNLAFPAFELSTYKNQKPDPKTIERLRARHVALETIYKNMQDELRPLLELLPANERTWENLQQMVPKWKDLNSSDLLPEDMLKAVEDSFDEPAPRRAMALSTRRAQTLASEGPVVNVSPNEAVLVN